MIDVQARAEAEYLRVRRQLIGGGLCLLGLVLIGVLWYRLIEGWSWVDAAYMAIITLATVGFGEVSPLGSRGRLFTIVLILMGVVVIAYILNCVTEALVQGHLQTGLQLHRRRRLMDSLQQHYIICGFGRTGSQVALEFAAEKIPFVVVDADAATVQQAQQLGYIAEQGDATQDQTLVKVGIYRAACLVTALPSDAENLYAVLSAKTLCPNIHTIARGSTEEAVQKLQRGGADVVVSPYITGGKRMAAAALRPQVVSFIDGILSGAQRTVYIEEFLIAEGQCPLIGQTLRQAKIRRQTGSLVLAIRRQDGSLIVGPDADTALYPQDLIISMGTAEDLRALGQLLSPL